MAVVPNLKLGALSSGGGEMKRMGGGGKQPGDGADGEWVSNLAAQREHGITIGGSGVPQRSDLGSHKNGVGNGAGSMVGSTTNLQSGGANPNAGLDSKVVLSREDTYVPLALAKERINVITLQLHEKQNSSLGELAKLTEYYESQNRATLQRWEEHMTKLKKDVRTRIAANLDRIAALEGEVAARDDKVANLEQRLKLALAAGGGAVYDAKAKAQWEADARKEQDALRDQITALRAENVQMQEHQLKEIDELKSAQQRVAELEQQLTAKADTIQRLHSPANGTRRPGTASAPAEKTDSADAAAAKFDSELSAVPAGLDDAAAAQWKLDFARTKHKELYAEYLRLQAAAQVIRATSGGGPGSAAIGGGSDGADPAVVKELNERLEQLNADFEAYRVAWNDRTVQTQRVEVRVADPNLVDPNKPLPVDADATAAGEIHRLRDANAALAKDINVLSRVLTEELRLAADVERANDAVTDAQRALDNAGKHDADGASAAAAAGAGAGADNSAQRNAAVAANAAKRAELEADVKRLSDESERADAAGKKKKKDVFKFLKEKGAPVAAEGGKVWWTEPDGTKRLFEAKKDLVDYPDAKAMFAETKELDGQKKRAAEESKQKAAELAALPTDDAVAASIPDGPAAAGAAGAAGAANGAGAGLSAAELQVRLTEAQNRAAEAKHKLDEYRRTHPPAAYATAAPAAFSAALLAAADGGAPQLAVMTDDAAAGVDQKAVDANPMTARAQRAELVKAQRLLNEAYALNAALKAEVAKATAAAADRDERLKKANADLEAAHANGGGGGGGSGVVGGVSAAEHDALAADKARFENESKAAAKELADALVRESELRVRIDEFKQMQKRISLFLKVTVAYAEDYVRFLKERANENLSVQQTQMAKYKDLEKQNKDPNTSAAARDDNTKAMEQIKRQLKALKTRKDEDTKALAEAEKELESAKANDTQSSSASAAEMEQMRAKLQSEMLELKAQLQGELEAAQKREREHLAAVDAANKRVADAATDGAGALTKARDDWEAEKKNLQAEAEKQKATDAALLTKLTGEKKKLEKAEAELKTKLAAADAKIAELQAAAKAADEKFAELEKKSKSQAGDVDALKSSVKALEAVKAELTAKVDRLQKEADKANEFKKQLEVKSADLVRVTAEREAMDKTMTELRVEYSKVLNDLEDLRGNIRVFCRCRPFREGLVDPDTKEPVTRIVKMKAGGLVEFTNEVKDVHNHTTTALKNFVFTQTFPEDVTQEQIYLECARFANLATEGNNACIFAYGQSGAGKTHTMAGNYTDRKNWGLKPRLIESIYAIAERNKDDYDYKLKFYMIEVYNNKFIDLIWASKNDPGGKKKLVNPANSSKVSLDEHGLLLVKDCLMVDDCKSPQDMIERTMVFEKERHARATPLNPDSSRGHMIFGLVVERYDKVVKKGAKPNVVCGKLSLIDLAGSEDPRKTELSEEAKKKMNAKQLEEYLVDKKAMAEEAKHINLSLGAIRSVVTALVGSDAKDKKDKAKGTPSSKSAGRPVVPYKESKLTELMKDSLGGNAKTLMFVNVRADSNFRNDTIRSLDWATLIRKVTNDQGGAAPKQNNAAELQSAYEEIEELKQKLAKYEGAGAAAGDE